MRPAKRDVDPRAKSHAGRYDGFDVVWVNAWSGWYVVVGTDTVGPFHTSQAAFGAAKDAIDELIREKMRCG